MMNARARTILFAIVVLFCAFPSTVWCQEVAEARVVNVTGEAFAMAPGETQWARLQEGERCVVGTRIRCGENAFAILEFAPGHRVKVDENTTIELSEMQYREDSGQEKTLIDLAAGRILNNVRKLRTEDSEYSVRTPTASAAVRGTIYEVRYEEETKRTSVRVLEGLIELEARIGRRLSSRIAEMEKRVWMRRAVWLPSKRCPTRKLRPCDSPPMRRKRPKRRQQKAKQPLEAWMPCKRTSWIELTRSRNDCPMRTALVAWICFRKKTMTIIEPGSSSRVLLNERGKFSEI